MSLNRFQFLPPVKLPRFSLTIGWVLFAQEEEASPPKVTKALDVSVTAVFPFITLKEKGGTALEIETQEHDRVAFQYLSLLLLPLVLGYSVYSLCYEEHKVAHPLLYFEW